MVSVVSNFTATELAALTPGTRGSRTVITAGTMLSLTVGRGGSTTATGTGE